MGDMLSQEEINALLRGIDDEPASGGASLSDDEVDAIGEVSNISMGTAATTLFSLVNQKVLITTPKVEVSTWEKLAANFDKSFVGIQIVYKEGLAGSNLLILKEDDVKIISDLMMGGEGVAFEGELTELHLSAIAEAMNQMIGSASTSMSSMFGKKIDINPPVSNYIDNSDFVDPSEIADFLTGDFIKVSFEMKIGELIDSELMQLYPMDFAQEIYKSFSQSKDANEEKQEAKPEPVQEAPSAPSAPSATQQPYPQQEQYAQQPFPQQPFPQQPFPQQPYPQQDGYSNQFRNIEVQQAQFQNFDMNGFIQQKENIDLIMDVALEVTVELGRTHKSIKEILEFAPGTIIELNKLAGEPIDVLVNGKIVAKGEVVVIDENFGIRITDIIKQVGGII